MAPRQTSAGAAAAATVNGSGAAVGAAAKAQPQRKSMSTTEDLLRKKYEAQGREMPTPAQRKASEMLGLRYFEDLRTLAFCCLYFAMIGLQLRFDFSSAHWTVRSALFWATAFLSFQGAVTVHNAVHCPIFRTHWKNQVFQVVLSVWFGHCASSYVPGHNLSHHRNLQTTKDVMRTTKMKFKWHFLNGLLFMPTILLSTSANDAAYFNAQAALKRPIYYQLRFEALVYVAFQVLVAAASPRRWLFVCWLPCLVGKYGIISLNMLQHDGCDTESKYNHSRNFVGYWLNYFCFNNGYHGIHHMYPGKHWSLLKHAHETRVKPHMHPALDQDNIFEFMWRQFVWPGLRLDFKGQPVPIVDDGPDEPWFYGTTESYSDRDVDTRVWDGKLHQFGPEKGAQGMAPRAAKVFATM